MKEMNGISVIIPAYNEKNALAKTISAIQAALTAQDKPFEIILVDDGSTDGTGEIAAQLTGIHLLRNHQNLGYGASLKRGIRAAQNDIIVITDADGSYPNERIPELINLLDENTEMVIGWRKGFDAKIPLVRRPAKWMIRHFAQWMAGYPIPDINSGLRVFHRAFVLEHLNLFPSGFSFTTTITLLTASSGAHIHYEPVEYLKREGKSKFHPIRDTWGMIILIIRSVMLFNPLRVFGAVALLSFFLGFIFLILTILLPVTYRATTTILFTTGIQFLGMGLLADLINRRSK